VKTIVETLSEFYKKVEQQTAAIKAVSDGANGVDYPIGGPFEEITAGLRELFNCASSNQTFKGMRRDMSNGQVRLL
jgi:hypothetical protein